RAAFGVFRRGHQALGLVIAPEPGMFLLRQQLAVDLDAVGGNDVDRGRGEGLAIEGNAAGLDPGFGFTPGAKPRARHHLGDALAGNAAHAAEVLWSWVAPGCAASIRAWNSFRSPGSTANSGCHCTPMQNLSRGSSMPSMTPSRATAFTTTPGPTVFTD